MGQALLGGVAREQEEAPGEGEGLEAGWGERALEPDPAGVASALIVALGFLIKSGLPATT